MGSSDYYIVDNSDIEQKTLEAAKSHYANGDYSSALKLYLGLINTSADFRLYHRIGKCYYKMNDFMHAKDYFLKSVGLEMYKNPSYTYLGNIAYKQELLKNAIYYWCCAYGYKPEDESICLNLATSYFSRGMKFQSMFYYDKYLKSAKNITDIFKSIKLSMDEYRKIGNEFYQKAKNAISRNNNKNAIEFLTFAVKNQPINFDINYLLGTTYLSENDNMHAMIYLKQALCIDYKSQDVLQKLSGVQLNLGDYTAAYCTMRRLLPLVIHNQSEYLKTMQIVKELSTTFDNTSWRSHKDWGDKYWEDNNYHLALLEYENCVMLNESMYTELEDKLLQLKLFIGNERLPVIFKQQQAQKTNVIAK